MCHHRECNVSIPTGPIAHLIVVEAGFAFGLFETLFNGIASRGDLGQGQQRRVRRRIGERSRRIRAAWSANVAPGANCPVPASGLDFLRPVGRPSRRCELLFPLPRPAGRCQRLSGQDATTAGIRTGRALSSRTRALKGLRPFPFQAGTPTSGRTSHTLFWTPTANTYQRPLSATAYRSARASP